MSNVIAFPGCAVPEPEPDSDAFAEWWEGEALPLVSEVDALMECATEAEFWSQAREIRQRLASWPIPEQPDG